MDIGETSVVIDVRFVWPWLSEAFYVYTCESVDAVATIKETPDDE